MSVENEPQGALGTSLLVFLLGIAVGAAAAILYAPASGTETRAQLAEKAEKIKDKASQVSERAVEWKDRITSRVKTDGTPDQAVAETTART